MREAGSCGNKWDHTDAFKKDSMGNLDQILFFGSQPDRWMGLFMTKGPWESAITIQLMFQVTMAAFGAVGEQTSGFSLI